MGSTGGRVMNKELAQEIYSVAHLTGVFQLRSGKTSSEYFDKYQFEALPHLLKNISKEMIPLLPKSFDLLGAMEMGGIPIATSIALQSGHPMVFVRKEAKSYGTCKFAEGPKIAGLRICLIEDVITTGGQVVISANMLREAGAIVQDVLCVIDRSMGDHSHLEEAGLKLTSLFEYKDFDGMS